MRLILGSASPRRRELLAKISVVPAEIRAADINEDPIPGELPRPYCQRMAREKADELGLEQLGVMRSFVVVGVDPAIMGIGPAVAIPKACEKAGIALDDVEVFEINEAFASQAVYCVRELGIDPALVNVNGGAIALGHPLGCTGAKLTATLLHEMKRRNNRYGVVSMCIGGGMGAAAVFENEAAASEA